jgi:hypothetical protein
MKFFHLPLCLDKTTRGKTFQVGIAATDLADDTDSEPQPPEKLTIHLEAGVARRFNTHDFKMVLDLSSLDRPLTSAGTCARLSVAVMDMMYAPGRGVVGSDANTTKPNSSNEVNVPDNNPRRRSISVLPRSEDRRANEVGTTCGSGWVALKADRCAKSSTSPTHISPTKPTR